MPTTRRSGPRVWPVYGYLTLALVVFLVLDAVVLVRDGHLEGRVVWSTVAMALAALVGWIHHLLTRHRPV